MVRYFTPCLVLLVTQISGCIPEMMHEFIGDNTNTTLVPDRVVDGNPAQPPPPARVSYAPASGDTGLRVDNIGRKILAANPGIGLKPAFATIGAPTPEVFHRGVAELYITEGLVKQCASENQLAAILCSELGKMVAEREALAVPQTRNPERRLPISVPYGNSGQIDAADQVRLAEEEKFDRERPRPTVYLPPPDPKVLARLYLKNAHYQEADFDAAAPLLQAAQENFDFERQIKGGSGASPWVPR
jgi:hypothetical protein